MQNDTEIQKLEKQIFTFATIQKVPFEFFEYFAKVVVNADNFTQIKVPEKVEDFFRSRKKTSAAALFQLLQQKGIASSAKSFTQAYASLFMYRYEVEFKKEVIYCLRRIQTPQEYGLYYKAGIKDASKNFYIAFEVDRYIPKKPDQSVDFEKLKTADTQTKNIASYFSTMTTLPNVSPLVWMNFEKITSRGFLPLVYKLELEDLIIDICYQTLFYFAQVVYKTLAQKLPLKEAVANLNAYYKTAVDPDSYTFSDDLELLEENLQQTLVTRLNNMDQLNGTTKEMVFYEMFEVILSFVRKGLMIPTFYYDAIWREASEFDMRDFRVRYAVDLYLYESDGSVSKKPLESYGIVVRDDKMEKIVKNSFQNEELYKRFIQLDK
jgi:hypothetical protein